MVKTLLALLIFSIAQSIYAADGRFYAGLGYGVTELDYGGSTRFQGTSGVPLGNHGSLDDDSGFKLIAGYLFNEHWGIEVEYLDRHSFDDSEFVSVDVFAPLDPGVTQYLSELSVETQGFNVSGLGIWPVADHVDIFAKAGLFFYENTIELTSTVVLADAADVLGIPPTIRIEQEDKGAELSFSVGAAYDATEYLAIRAEYQLMNGVEDSDLEMLSVSAVYKF